MLNKAIIPILFLTCFAGAQTTKPVEIPTRVSVKIENETLEDALQDISNAIKAPLQLSNMNRRRAMGGIVNNLPGAGGNAGVAINLAEENQPVLKVIYDLIQQAHIAPSMNDQPSPGTSFDMRTPVRIELIDDRMLLIINQVSMNANSNVQGGESNYSYNYQGTILFDPAMKVISVGNNSKVVTLQSPDAQLRELNFGNEQLQRVDGRGLASHTFNIQLQTNKRLKEIPSMTVNLKAYQVVDDLQTQITNADLLNGGKNEVEGLSLSAPPVDQNGVNITVGGKVYAELRNQYPWNQYISTFLKLDGAAGPVTGVYCNNMNQNNDSMTFRLTRRQGQVTADEIDTVSFSLPTKIKQMNVTITLNDMPVP